MQELFRAVLGTNNIDNCARVCHAPTVAGLAKSFGSGAMTNSFKDFAKAKMIIAIGRNMTEAHPVVATFVKNAVDDGAELIVVDPRHPGGWCGWPSISGRPVPTGSPMRLSMRSPNRPSTRRVPFGWKR